MKKFLLVVILIAPYVCSADEQTVSLCFSPVTKAKGDRAVPLAKEGDASSFEYSIQVDDGEIVKPSGENSTLYPTTRKRPLVKIRNAGELVKSFHIEPKQIQEGRTCIWFNSLYETWQLVQPWQSRKLCGCKP